MEFELVVVRIRDKRVVGLKVASEVTDIVILEVSYCSVLTIVHHILKDFGILEGFLNFKSRLVLDFAGQSF